MPGLKDVMDRLQELEAGIHPTLSVYRWWRPDMRLPAVWNWMTPGTAESKGQPNCRIRDVVRITVSITVDPTAIAGEGDMLEAEAYFDLALDVLDPVIFGRNPLGVREAYRRGAQTTASELGDASVLNLEIPLEVYIDRNVSLNP